MTIRTRITIVAVSVMLLVVFILIGFGYQSQKAADKRYIAEVMYGKRLLWDQLATRLQENMAGYSNSLTRDRVGLKALRKGNLDVVKEQLATTHNMLTADGTLQRIQLFDTKGNYLVALPDGFSGATGKSLVQQVLSDSKNAFGINRDDDGSLQVAAAFPLFVRGKLRAVALYSQDLQALLDSFQSTDDAEVVVYDMSGRVDGAAKGNELPDEAMAWSFESDGGLEVVGDDGKYRVVVGVPVLDERGEIIARLVTSDDQTESYRLQILSTYTSIGLVLIVLTGSAVGLFWYFRRVFRPIERVVHAMTSISNGQLNIDLPEDRSDDETGRLTAGLNEMVQQLSDLIGQISQSTENLLGSTEHLTDIADQSNRRIELQSEEIDQVATAANEMSVTIQEVAKSAANAARAANHASKQTREGSDTVGRMIGSIEGLSNEVKQASQVISRLQGESESIGSVLDVIRGIAEQTNLLALNAAIEAARAGEQGRGFAVVADEVRMLASRTQQSTQDIQMMIEKLQQGANEAVQVMQHSHDSSSATLERAITASTVLGEITSSVKEIDDMNSHIANATKEQSSASEIISQSAARIASLAEESMTASAETAQTAGNIANTGSELGRLINRFKL